MEKQSGDFLKGSARDGIMKAFLSCWREELQTICWDQDKHKNLRVYLAYDPNAKKMIRIQDGMPSPELLFTSDNW